MEKNLYKTLISLKLYHLNIIIKDIDMKVGTETNDLNKGEKWTWKSY